MSAEAIPGLYRRHAAAFDRLRGRTLLERHWLDRFVALLPLGGEVLDLGCGMGEPVAAGLVRRGHAVTGVDSSGPLLELARARMPAQRWIEADMRGLDLGRRFAGVLAWDSFFHLARDDQRAIFPVFARHAAEGAPLMFNTGPEEGEALGLFEGETLFHASLSPTEYRSLLDEAGFGVVAHCAEDPDCGGRTVWLARRRAQAASGG
jgi:SAM-dependent methyltransferase